MQDISLKPIDSEKSQTTLGQSVVDQRREFFKNWRELQVIAQRVGGDFGMSVSIGQAGGGSYFSLDKKEITLDPLHIIEDPGFAKFVASHEGSHRAITLSPQKFGLTKEQVKAYYKQLGFAFCQNVLEDGAVNDWKDKTYHGLYPETRRFYDGQFKDPDAVLSTPEVVRVFNRLGRWPLFARMGSELLRDWHTVRSEFGIDGDLTQGGLGRFSPTVSPRVREALDRVLVKSRECISCIPAPGSRNHAEIKRTGFERFKIAAHVVYPEMAKLAAYDLGIEIGRQVYEKFREKVEKLGDLQKELDEIKAGKGDRKKEEVESEIEKLKKETSAFHAVPEELRREIEEKRKQFIKDRVKEFIKQAKEITQKIRESQAREKALEESKSGSAGDNSQESDNAISDAIDIEKSKQQELEKKLDQAIERDLGNDEDLKEKIKQGAKNDSAGGQSSERDDNSSDEAGRQQDINKDSSPESNPEDGGEASQDSAGDNDMSGRGEEQQSDDSASDAHDTDRSEGQDGEEAGEQDGAEGAEDDSEGAGAGEGGSENGDGQEGSAQSGSSAGAAAGGEGQSTSRSEQESADGEGSDSSGVDDSEELDGDAEAGEAGEGDGSESSGQSGSSGASSAQGAASGGTQSGGAMQSGASGTSGQGAVQQGSSQQSAAGQASSSSEAGHSSGEELPGGSDEESDISSQGSRGDYKNSPGAGSPKSGAKQSGDQSNGQTDSGERSKEQLGGAKNSSGMSAQTSSESPMGSSAVDKGSNSHSEEIEAGSKSSDGKRNSAGGLDDLEQEIEQRFEEKIREDGKGSPIPYDDLSEEAQHELEKMAASLEDDELEALKQSAGESLRELEKALSDSLRGKLNEKPEDGTASDSDSEGGGDDSSSSSSKSSKQGGKGSGSNDTKGESQSISDGAKDWSKESGYKREEKADAQPIEKPARESTLEMKRTAQQQKKAAKITQAKSDSPGEFLEASSQVAKQLEKTKQVFRRILTPTEDAELQSGRSRGRLDVNKAMRLDQEPHLISELFVNWSDPIEISHAFGSLFDRSISMAGENAAEAYRSAVFLAKLLDWERLKIPNAQWVFSDDVYETKGFKDKISNPEVQKSLGAVLQVCGGTNDAKAILSAYQELVKRKEKFKFLPIISDSGTGTINELKKVVDYIKSEGKVILVHFGIGAGTTDQNQVYPYSFGELSTAVGSERNFAKTLELFVKLAIRYPKRFFDYSNAGAIIEKIERLISK